MTNRQFVSVRIGNKIETASKTHIRMFRQLSNDVMTGSVNDVIKRLSEISEGLENVTISMDSYAECYEEYGGRSHDITINYYVESWRPATEKEKVKIEAAFEKDKKDKEAKAAANKKLVDQQKKRKEAADRKLLAKLKAQYEK